MLDSYSNVLIKSYRILNVPAVDGSKAPPVVAFFKQRCPVIRIAEGIIVSPGITEIILRAGPDDGRQLGMIDKDHIIPLTPPSPGFRKRPLYQGILPCLWQSPSPLLAACPDALVALP